LNMETDSARKKSKKIDIQIAGAFILAALYSVLMASVAIGVAAQLVQEPSGPDAIYLISLIATFVICATLHGEFLLLVHGITYLFLLPTMYLILIMFAIANLHDQAWGTRDSSGQSKETDEDKFFSISKLGGWIRDLKSTWRQALYDEKPKPKEEEESNSKEEEKKKQSDNYWSDGGKEEIIMLEEERRRIEEEKKKQEEEKKKTRRRKKIKRNRKTKRRCKKEKNKKRKKEKDYKKN